METVLVPYDGSDPSVAALEYAVENLGEKSIILLHVVDPHERIYGDMLTVSGYDVEWFEHVHEQEAEELFEEARGHVDGDAFETEVVTGQPARSIVEYAEEHDVDHIVMGSHGRSGVTRIFLGSVAETVIRRSPCPVTVVR